MSDDDHSPASENDEPAVASGFSAFGEEDRKAEQRAKRKNLTTKVVAGALVLVAVGAVAALTGNKSARSTKPPAAPPTVGPGKVVSPAPAQVVFETDLLGYALYLDCDKQPVGQGCEPALWRTVDGAKSWDPLPLPAGTPVDPTEFLSMQVNASYLLLAWTSNFVAALPNPGTPKDGSGWARVQRTPGGVVSTLSPGDFFIGTSTPMLVVDPATAEATEFRPPQSVQVSPLAGGALADDGKLWLHDPANLGVSTNFGVSWNVSPVPDADLEADPLAGGGEFLALLTGPVKGATTGIPGDGALLPAGTAYFSTNSGVSWDSPTTLTGPTVNALCTVYLGDHSLLGVSADGKSLLSLPAGRSAFVKATPAPGAIPACLQSHGDLVWGVTLTTNQLVLSTGKTPAWSVRKLPVGLHAVATPSPTPSAVK